MKERSKMLDLRAKTIDGAENRTRNLWLTIRIGKTHRSLYCVESGSTPVGLVGRFQQDAVSWDAIVFKSH